MARLILLSALLVFVRPSVASFCPNACGYSDICRGYSGYVEDCVQIMPGWTALYSIFFPLYLLVGIFTSFQLCRLCGRRFNIQLLVHLFTLLMAFFGMTQHICGILINDSTLSYGWHKVRERTMEISVGLSNWAFFSMLYCILLFWVEILRSARGIGIMQRLRWAALSLVLLLLLVEVVHRVLNLSGFAMDLWVPIVYCIYYFATTMVVVVGMNVYARRIKRRLTRNGNSSKYSTICLIGTATTVIGCLLMLCHVSVTLGMILLPKSLTNTVRLTTYYFFPTLKLSLTAVVLIGLRPRKNPNREITARVRIAPQVDHYECDYPFDEETQEDKLAALLSPSNREPLTAPYFYPVPSGDALSAGLPTTPHSVGSSLAGVVFEPSPMTATSGRPTPNFLTSPHSNRSGHQPQVSAGRGPAASMFASMGG